jgi:hypothetical protein
MALAKLVSDAGDVTGSGKPVLGTHACRFSGGPAGCRGTNLALSSPETAEKAEPAEDQ